MYIFEVNGLIDELIVIERLVFSVPGEHQAYDAAGGGGTLAANVHSNTAVYLNLSRCQSDFHSLLPFSRVKMLESELWSCWMNKEVINDLPSGGSGLLGHSPKVGTGRKLEILGIHLK